MVLLKQLKKSQITKGESFLSLDKKIK